MAIRRRGESKYPANISTSSQHHAQQLHTHANMADAQPTTQPQGESSENLHTDPVTGEKISKSELKRRQKQREKDEKKKEKEAAMPARPKKEKKDDAEELNPNVCDSAPAKWTFN